MIEFLWDLIDWLFEVACGPTPATLNFSFTWYSFSTYKTSVEDRVVP